MTACTSVVPVLPQNLADNSVALPIKGTNGLNGRYTIATRDGGTVGGRRRGRARAMSFLSRDTLRTFKTRFSVEAPGQPTIDAQYEASMQDRTLPMTDISIQITPVDYDCVFTRDGKDFGSLTLSDDPASHIALYRSGRLDWDSKSYIVESEHRDAASGLVLDTAVGYTFVDTTGPVALVSANLDGMLYLSRTASAEDEAAMQAAAIAMALFRDPSDIGH